MGCLDIFSLAHTPLSGSTGAMTVSRPGPFYKWWVVVMLWFVCFFNYADRQAIFSVAPKLKEEFGFDKQQLGYIFSAFMWVYAAGAPFAGFIGDCVKRKHLILGGCLFWSFVTITTSWCGKFRDFVVVRALEGLGETFYFPASMSLLSDYHSRQTRSRALSFHQSSVYVGTILGSWVGAWFAEKHGWRTGFYFFGLAGMVLGVALYRFLREPARDEAETQSAERLDPNPPRVSEVLRDVFRTPTALLLMIAFVCANFVATIFLSWTPTFLVEKFHFKLAAAGLNGTVYIHLASALAVPLAGAWADSLSRRQKGGRMLVQASGLLLGAGFVFLVGKTSNLATLILSMTVFGACKGAYDSGIFASLYDVVAPRSRATAAGLMNTIGWGGGALGPVFVGYWSKHGGHETEVENMSHAISYCGPIYLVGGLLLLLAMVLFVKQNTIASAERL
jgi:MFS family permease